MLLLGDYSRKLISRGGGVFARGAKSIALSSQMRELLGLDTASATPLDVIRAMLIMPVDLLWNGGIGTYVKGTSESHAQIGDRTNDALRVNGAERTPRSWAKAATWVCRSWDGSSTHSRAAG